MEAADYSEGGGDNGDIDSVAPTTAPTGHKVTEDGKAPTDCAGKKKGQRQKERKEVERGSREKDIERLR